MLGSCRFIEMFHDMNGFLIVIVEVAKLVTTFKTIMKEFIGSTCTCFFLADLASRRVKNRNVCIPIKLATRL